METSPVKKKFQFNISFGKIKTTQKLFLIQQMQIMVKAGVPLTNTLETLIEQTKPSKMRTVLVEMKESIEKGTPLSDAMRPYEKDFGELVINMIAAGEASGRLDEVLQQVYLQLKKDHEIMAKVRGALTYPAIVVMAMFGIGTFMIIFVIPKLTSLFKEVNAELPLPTKILILISDFITQHGIIAFVGTVSFIGLFVWTIRTSKGKYLWHSLLLKMPVVGSIIRKVNVARFARTVSSFLKTDIPIVKTLQTTSRVLGNVHYKKALVSASEEVIKGITLEKALSPYAHLFNPTILQMIRVGEESGSLDEMLAEAASFYEAEVEQTMNTLPSLLEPILMLMLGVGVGGMAVAIIMPLYSLTQSF